MAVQQNKSKSQKHWHLHWPWWALMMIADDADGWSFMMIDDGQCWIMLCFMFCLNQCLLLSSLCFLFGGLVFPTCLNSSFGAPPRSFQMLAQSYWSAILAQAQPTSQRFSKQGYGKGCEEATGWSGKLWSHAGSYVLDHGCLFRCWIYLLLNDWVHNANSHVLTNIFWIW